MNTDEIGVYLALLVAVCIGALCIVLTIAAARWLLGL